MEIIRTDLLKEYISLCRCQYARAKQREKDIEKQIRYKKSLIADLTARRQNCGIFAIKQKTTPIRKKITLQFT